MLTGKHQSQSRVRNHPPRTALHKHGTGDFGPSAVIKSRCKLSFLMKFLECIFTVTNTTLEL